MNEKLARLGGSLSSLPFDVRVLPATKITSSSKNLYAIKKEYDTGVASIFLRPQNQCWIITGDHADDGLSVLFDGEFDDVYAHFVIWHEIAHCFAQYHRMNLSTKQHEAFADWIGIVALEKRYFEMGYGKKIISIREQSKTIEYKNADWLKKSLSRVSKREGFVPPIEYWVDWFLKNSN